MQLAIEAELVQNSALGASLLWAFTLEYCKQRGDGSGPPMPISLAVLPMTFHQESVDVLHRRNFEGGLDLALVENRILVVDLQERVQAMLQQTMKALNIAFATNLLTYVQVTGELKAVRKTDPFNIGSQEVRRMMHTATRVGYWFATIDLERIGPLLRIRI